MQWWSQGHKPQGQGLNPQGKGRGQELDSQGQDHGLQIVLEDRILEDEDLSSRTPTLVNIELNVLVKRRILYTFTQ